MKIHGVGQISISVTDVDRAVEFYRDILGINFLFQVPGDNPMAFFDCSGIRLYINQPENPEHAGTSVIYFQVDSAQDSAKELDVTRGNHRIRTAHHPPDRELHALDGLLPRPGRQSHGRHERRGRFDGLKFLHSGRRKISETADHRRFDKRSRNPNATNTTANGIQM